jgi:C1A family cysteine protease
MHFIYLCVVCVCLIGLSNETALSDLPTNYDFFDAFPGCIPTTKDQGTCGDCYAFASSSMMSLRVCREANGLYLPDFSPQDMSSCNSLTDGCDGGIISYGFQYMELFGLTTEACTPYSDVAEATASACTWACTDGGETYVKVYCQSQSTSRIEDLERVKIELYDHGPLVVTFWCYDDLFDYEEADYHEGIYVSDGSGAPGGHAVLLVGKYIYKQ